MSAFSLEDALDQLGEATELHRKAKENWKACDHPFEGSDYDSYLKAVEARDEAFREAVKHALGMGGR